MYKPSNYSSYWQWRMFQFATVYFFFHYCVDIKWHLMNDCIPVISKLDANREELEDCPPPRQYLIQLSYQKALPQLSPWQRNEKLLFRY